jgi:pimeloyl-ACP methyl ester carboxylesterase
VLGEEPFEQLPEARVEQMRDNLSTMRAQMLGAGYPELGCDDDIRGIQAPALLVTGKLTPPPILDVVLPLTDRLEALLPIAERVEIPNASHVMHEENAPAVNEAIVGFLGRHRD